MPNPWLLHLAKFKADNPHLRGRVVMEKARLTYHNRTSCQTTNLTNFLNKFVLGQMADKYAALGKVQDEAQQLKNRLDNTQNQLLSNVIDILCEYLDFGFLQDINDIVLLNIVRENDYKIVRELIHAYHSDGGKHFLSLKYEE